MENGRPISSRQFDRMLDQLRQWLDLRGEERLLDPCCGYGVITARRAEPATEMVGGDLSPELIRAANSHQGRASITFLQGDLHRLAEMAELRGRGFSKVAMQAALQHFAPADFEPLLRSIPALCAPAPVIVFGFVPEDGKQRHLFNTPRRRLNRIWLRATGRIAETGLGPGRPSPAGRPRQGNGRHSQGEPGLR